MPDIYSANYSTPGMSASTHETAQNQFCCTYDDVLLNLEQPITIVSADKTPDGSSYYIAYHIQFSSYDVRRRYSEFESLRDSLSKLYPTVLVPPIPDKHSIAQYATKQTRAKEDIQMIEKRKRMLQSFLNRVVAHPILASEHIFHRFLERDTNWSEVLNSPPLSTLPKNPLTTPIMNGGSDSNIPSSTSMVGTPVIKPGPLATLKNPDPQFTRAEEFTIKFHNIISGPLSKAHKNLHRKLLDSSKDLGELGGFYNGFSLTEKNGLGDAIEKTGQAVDNSYMLLGNLGSGLEEVISEPLEEYAKYSIIAQRALKHRTTKHLQLERATELLEAKKSGLERLELAEQESKRLAAALQRETEARDPYSDDESLYPDDEIRRPRSAALPQTPGHDEESTQSDSDERRDATRSLSTGDVTQAVNTSSSGGGHLLNLLSYTLHGLIDVDPEGSRRSSITKTKEQILGLENLVENMTNGLELTSAALQRDLDRFQLQKQADINKALTDFARLHRDYCQANLQAWEEALAEAERIPTGNIPCRALKNNQPSKKPLDSSNP